MAYPQTSVVTDQAVAFEGMAGGGKPVVDPVFNEEASAGIGFGLFVGLGTKSQGALLLADITDTVLGVSLHSHEHAIPERLTTDGELAPKAPFNLVTGGRVWVQVLSAVALGDGVHIIAENIAGGEKAGMCRPTQDGTDTIDASAWCRWVSPSVTAPSGALVAELLIDISGEQA